MTALVGALAHGLHYLLVLGGLAGVGCLLLPRLVHGGSSARPRSPEQRRIDDLRYTAEVGLLGTGALLSRPRTRPAPVPSASPWLAIALVSSAAASGVHAAVAPAHFAEGPLVGGFFLAAAVFQLGWAMSCLRGATRRLLEVGAGVSLAFVALWAATRLPGVPLGPLLHHEPVGSWDLAAVGWELVVVVAAMAEVSRGLARVGPCRTWPGRVRVWLVVSVVVLGTLSAVAVGG